MLTKLDYQLLLQQQKLSIKETFTKNMTELVPLPYLIRGVKYFVFPASRLAYHVLNKDR